MMSLERGRGKRKELNQTECQKGTAGPVVTRAADGIVAKEPG